MSHYDPAEIAAAYDVDVADDCPVVTIDFPDWALMPTTGWTTPRTTADLQERMLAMKRPLVTLQVLRGEDWEDFATGPIGAAQRHIDQNTPGIWRAVNVAGEVILRARPADPHDEVQVKA